MINGIERWMSRKRKNSRLATFSSLDSFRGSFRPYVQKRAPPDICLDSGLFPHIPHDLFSCYHLLPISLQMMIFNVLKKVIININTFANSLLLVLSLFPS